MDFNNNHRWVDHLINARRFPEKAAAAQADLNRYRRARIETAAATRPIYLSLFYDLPGEELISPISQTTPDLRYDCVITGVIASTTQNRRIIFKKAESELPFVILEQQATNLRLTLEDLAGNSDATNQQRIFYFPTPLDLRAGERLSIEIFDTNEAEELQIVFVGYRVLPPGSNTVNPEQQALITRYLQFRRTPEIRLLTQRIIFDADQPNAKTGLIFSPQAAEPLLIRGCRSSLNVSTIRLRIEGEPEWSPAAFPIFALATQTGVGQQNYEYFERPIFLPAKTAIEMELTNSVDSSGIFDNSLEVSREITWLCETV